MIIRYAKFTANINNLGLFKKSLSAIFFYKTNPEPPLQHQNKIIKKQRKKDLQEAIVTAGEIRAGFRTKVAYGDFLKRPEKFPMQSSFILNNRD